MMRPKCRPQELAWPPEGEALSTKEWVFVGIAITIALAAFIAAVWAAITLLALLH